MDDLKAKDVVTVKEDVVVSSSGESSSTEEGSIDIEPVEITTSDDTDTHSSSNTNNDNDYSVEEEVANGDWDNYGMELQLPQEFVHSLIVHYGSQPVPGIDLSRVKDPDDRKIRVSPEMAFEIYRFLYNSVGKVASPQGVKFEDGDQAAGCSRPYSSSLGDGHGSQWDNGEEDEDFQSILRQIKEQEEEEDRAFAEQLDKLEKERSEQAAVCEFKDIIERDKINAARELAKIQELRKIKWTMAQNIKCSQIKALFPSLLPKTVEETFLKNGMDYDQTLISLKDVYPSKYVENVSRGEIKPVTRNRSPSGNDWVYQPEVVAELTQMEKSRMLQQSLLWRKAADEFSSMYNDAKNDAEGHKGMKQVYALKNMAASKLARSAKDALEQYWFFTLMGLNGGNKNPSKIDLHGLSVNKAKDIVQKYIQNRKMWAEKHLSKNDSLKLTIICGQGRHSVNNTPRLNPAIKQFLSDNNFSFTEGNGFFHVRLPSVDELKLIDRPAKKVATKPRKIFVA